MVLTACSLAGGTSRRRVDRVEDALPGPVPMLLGVGVEVVVAATVPVDDRLGGAVGLAVHRALTTGGDAAEGLAAARRSAAVDGDGASWATAAGISAFRAFA